MYAYWWPKIIGASPSPNIEYPSGLHFPIDTCSIASSALSAIQKGVSRSPASQQLAVDNLTSR